jgi:Ca2+-binding RTX toxin-like protein
MDLLNGGDGVDAADYSYASVALAVTVASTGTVTVTVVAGSDVDTLIAVENVTGGGGDDTLIGDSGANSLAGGTGNDYLRGGGGNDTLNGGSSLGDTVDYSYTNTGVSISLNASGNATVTVAAGSDVDLLMGVEHLIGGGGNDTLTGFGISNTLSGGGGNDILNGDGGTDTADYTYATTALSVSLSETGGATVTVVAGSDVDTITSIENIRAGSGSDLLVGNSAVNVLSGGNGHDVLMGLGGNDTLYGGIGDDELYGGDGVNLLDGGTGRDTANFFGLTVGIVLSGTTVSTGDTLTDIEVVVGTSNNDTLRASAQIMELFGADGNDTYQIDAFVSGSDYQNGQHVPFFEYVPGNDVIEVDLDLLGQFFIPGTELVFVQKTDPLFGNPFFYDGTNFTPQSFATQFFLVDAGNTLYYDDNGNAQGYSVVANLSEIGLEVPTVQAVQLN